MLTDQRHNGLLLLASAIWCGVALVLGSAAFARQTADKPKSAETQKGAVDEKTIRDLIEQLGDENFAKREEASKRLAAIGEPVRELVKKAAAASADAEVRQRAEEVLRALGLAALAVPDPVALAKKPSPADGLKRSDIPAEVLAKMGTGTGDAPKELVAVLGKPDAKYRVISISLSADGRYLATGGKDDHKAQLFDLQTG
jgi:hypothetical protein